MVTRETVIQRLLAMPALIGAAENGLLQDEEVRRLRAQVLQEREDTMLLAGLDGKNDQIRQAQLRAATAQERQALAESEMQIARNKAGLHHLQIEHASLRAIARLLAGSDP